MLVEGAGKERGFSSRERGVAVLPQPAIDAGHDVGTAGDHADRQTATDHFAIGHEIGPYTEVRLRTARVNAESGQHFIENQYRAGSLRDCAQRMQECRWLQSGVAALHRLDQHRREFADARFEQFQRCRAAVFEHREIRHHAGHDAGHSWRRRPGIAMRFAQHAVEMTVVAVAEHRNLCAAAGGTCQPQGSHDGFGAGIAECDTFDAGQFGDQFRHFAGRI